MIAERFRRVSAGLTARVDAITDWEAPTPCASWTARDVLAHLVGWVPDMIGGGAGIAFPALPADPVAAWPLRRDALQDIVDDPIRSALPFHNPHTSGHRLDEAIDRFVMGDVLLHTWDLARAGGLDERLDAEAVDAMLPGIEAMGDALAQSGQFGPRLPVAPDADPQTRLLAFAGRDATSIGNAH